MKSLQRFARSPSALFGACVVAAVILLAVLAPLLAPYDPVKQVLGDRMQAPSQRHLLGTDRLGRDVLSRVMWGSRISLSLSLAAVALATAAGTIIGLMSGFFGGWLDLILMRLVDVMLAFPLYLMALVVVAFLGPSVPNMILSIAIAGAPTFARLTRGEVLALRERIYVEAARAVGARAGRLMFRHILPNLLGPLMVASSLAVGTAILVESTLGFLGLGLSPPTPAWGLMVNEGLQIMRGAWWAPVFPGIGITLAVLGFNLLGDGLRDLLDPRLRSVR